MFLTSTPPILTSSHWPPPHSMGPLLRTFSLPVPDPTLVVRAHCTALGLKAPKALANKLINLQTSANQQL